MLQVLDGKQLQNISKSAEYNLNIQVSSYNDQCYLRNIQKDIDQYAVDRSSETQKGDIDIIEFRKDHPYISDLTLYTYIYIYMNLKRMKK